MGPKPTVYLETTIPSFYVETREDPASAYMRTLTRRWWDERRGAFSPVTSAFTLLELEAAPSAIAIGALALMKEIPVLPLPGSFEGIVSTLIEHHVMPVDEKGDAAHLAVAAGYGCDYLLTWNCRHLANAQKTRHIEAVCRMLGLVAPLIVTPEGLMEAAS
jgi:hypothetical protein